MGTETVDPMDPIASSISLEPKSETETKTATEPKVLTLQFSKNGASIGFQTPNEIKESLDFIKLGDTISGNVSLPIAQGIAGSRVGLATNKTYADILNDTVMDRLIDDYEALSKEAKKIHDHILDKKIRQNFRRKAAKNHKINLSFAIKSKDINSFEFQGYLAQVTQQLESEGLWREELSESTESDLFLINDAKDEDLDENLNPKELHKIYNPQKMSTKKDSLQELKEEGLEWKDEISISASYLPAVTTPTINNLIRRAPWGINETVARQMTEGSFFSNYPNLENLFPCAYFVSKSIFSREMFIQVKYEAFARTPLQKKFRTYSYRSYLKDQQTLEKLTTEILKKYFHQNPFVRKNTEKLLSESPDKKHAAETHLNTIWQRYFKVTRSLTKKQAEALAAIYTQVPPLTYEEAAAKDRISKDSFQDRVRGAVKKIKHALPELDNLTQSKTYFKSKSRRLLYNGLFCKDSAQKIHKLFQIDLKTNERVEIATDIFKPADRLNKPSKEAVRAWAIAQTPIPDILDTDFYLGLVPEGCIRRKTGRTKFRG